MPAEVLTTIAEHIDPKTQFNLWKTSKQLHQTLQGQLCYQQFGLAEFELPLANLPAFIDPKRGVIAVLYEDVYESEVAAIRFQDGKYAVRVFTYHNTASNSDDDAESDYVAGHVGGYPGTGWCLLKCATSQKCRRSYAMHPFTWTGYTRRTAKYC